jgi:BlaI family transcriptional regulator, penicillinase repressor
MKVSRLPRREREVAEIVYARGEASAIDVCESLSDPISNAAVRSMLTRLEAKGVLRRRKEGRRFFYAPAGDEQAARESALRRVSGEHFGGSLAGLAAAALELAKTELDAAAGALALAQAPLQTHQPTPMARTRARPARQSGAGRIGSISSGMLREPEIIGPSRLSRLISQ